MDIGPDEWIRLRLEIELTRVTASINGETAMIITEPKARAVPGALGLFVDIGADAFFAGLAVTPAVSEQA